MAAVVLTREAVRRHLRRLTVAPITSTVRGLSTEVPVGPQNELDHDGVVSCDDVTTIVSIRLGRRIGALLPAQEVLLTRAITAVFDLETD